MAKLVYALLLVVLIEAALYLFGGTTYANSSLFSLMQDPSNLDSLPFYQLFGDTIILFAGTAAIIAGLIFQKTDTGFFALLAGGLITFSISIIHLWIFINANIESLFGINGWVVASLVTLPISIQYIVTMVALVGNRPD